ncbi:amine oxidase [Plakobranchus ocellatus]|uniref:Amine oxidase n=1 Tax=Plakobranchus ocellatus TaxID=259542 RepID=A0AAV4AY17_9GAST|nr:amine oxidase [Plakobranchus ocellatus]
MDDEEHLSTNLASPSRTFIPPAASTPIKLLPTKSIAISPIIEQSMQTKESTTSPLIKFIDTISHAMNKSLSHPLSEHEERLASRLVQRKLYDGPQKRKTLLKIKTRGQPLTYMKVAVPRKCSQNVGATTLKKRARLMHSARRVVDSKMDVELGLIPQTRRQQVINKVNVSKKLLIGRRQGLILKETLGLSIRKARLMCQQLRELGVFIEGEASQRALAKGIIQDFVNVREKIFHKEDCSDITTVPYTRINRIPAFVKEHLTQMKEKNVLTWHNMHIPKDQIWVKIGGDHGKNLLKLTLEIANTETPNSQRNTVVIAMAAVKDSYQNLQTFLDGGLKQDIQELMDEFWDDKRIHVTLNGDYEFICKMYGISGAQGTHPCVWCLTTKQAMQIPSETHTLRTLEQITEDHNKFINEQKGNKKEVHKYYNCLHSPLLPIPLENVVPPYLHIMLGITWRHHVLLKREAHRLDLQIVSQNAKHATERGSEIKKFGKQWDRVEKLRAQLDLLEHHITFAESETEKEMFGTYFEKVDQELESINYIELEENTGPIALSLNKILTKHRVSSQPYQGVHLLATTATNMCQQRFMNA